MKFDCFSRELTFWVAAKKDVHMDDGGVVQRHQLGVVAGTASECMYVCMYVCMYACMYVFICV